MEKYPYIKHMKFDEAVVDGEHWVQSVVDLTKLNCVGAITKCAFLNREISKDVIADKLCAVLKIVNRQNRYIGFLEKQSQELKSEAIMDKAAVIDLQKELLAAKNEQLAELKASVVSSVEETVKTELGSYSNAVIQPSKCSDAGAQLDQKILKSVVKDVVAEEDRTRTLMVFGLREEPEEQVREKVGNVFVELGEKPIIEASRIGKKDPKSSNERVRPVKVTFSSSMIVQQILSKARNLRNSDNFKHVFLSEDRSIEERAKHRELVLELKRKRTEEPGKQFYIRGGKLCSTET